MCGINPSNNGNQRHTGSNQKASPIPAPGTPGAVRGSTVDPNAGGKPTGGSSNQALLAEINRVRKANGLNTLQELPKLTAISRANDAANNRTGNLDHHVRGNGSDGQITAFYSGGETAAKAVDQWMNSPRHRRILLDPNQTYVGLSISGNYATADFI